MDDNFVDLAATRIGDLGGLDIFRRRVERDEIKDLSPFGDGGPEGAISEIEYALADPDEWGLEPEQADFMQTSMDGETDPLPEADLVEKGWITKPHDFSDLE